MTVLDSSELRFVGGTSDKTYIASIEREMISGNFVVSCRYGRTGNENATANKGSFYKYEEAFGVYAKVISEKKHKGYRLVGATKSGEESQAQTASSQNPVEQSKPFATTTHLPQLLNVIDEAGLEVVLSSGDWIMEQKMDGNRVQIAFVGAAGNRISVVAFNKKGNSIELPRSVRDEILCINATIAWKEGVTLLLIDGELIGETYHYFDCLIFDSIDISTKRYEERRSIANEILQDGKHIQAVGSRDCTYDGVAALRLMNAEGAVFKRKGSAYSPGRPNSGGDMLKFKFTESSTCIVTSINKARSVEVGLWSVQHSWSDEPKKIIVGNVTIPANAPIPSVGELIEVRYLYMFLGGSLYQPVYLSTRNDVDSEECSLSQVLRFKPIADEDED